MAVDNDRVNYLAVRWIAGDDSVFPELYKLVNPTYLYVARKGARSEPNAQDIAQDAWIKIINNRDKWDINISNFKTWSERIVRNTKIDYMRKDDKNLYKQCKGWFGYRNSQGSNEVHYKDVSVSLKNRMNYEGSDEELLLDRLPSLAKNIEDRLESDHLDSMLVDACESVSGFSGEVVCMHLLEGMSIQEIADVIGKQYHAVAKALGRGKKKLREILEIRGISP